jgi:DNA-binding GntR family transcriptional regulator
MATTESTTRADEVFRGIRSELLCGRLAPGQRLKLVELAGRFGVSLSVVREVLLRLTGEGLVIATPQRGFRVMDLSVDDLADLTQTRVHLESLALRQAMAHGGLDWEAAVVSAHHTLRRTPLTNEDGQLNEDWTAAHRSFHQALVSGCRSPRLESIVMGLRDCAELYRSWYWALTDEADPDPDGDHRRLKDLALRRDADAAVALLAEHIGRAPRELIARAQEHHRREHHPDDAPPRSSHT